MNYYEQNDRRGRVWGIIGVALYLALCVGVMFITYSISLPEPQLGVVIDFGVTDTGGGDEDTALSEQDAVPVSPSGPDVSAEPVLVTEEPDAPAVVAETNPRTQATTTVAPTTPVREVNPRAMFPGRTEGSASASQGPDEGVGNRGSVDGGPQGSDSAGGTGIEGFTLAGRFGTGNWPLPKYQIEEEGKVVIRIVVSPEGVVTSATFQQEGSTTNVGELVNAARAAALRARFTESEAVAQTGTIIYNFTQTKR